MIQAQYFMNFGSLFIKLKSLDTRPFYALENLTKFPAYRSQNNTYTKHATK